jgi:DNA-binding GntR family transcriptional regulator
MKLTGSNTRMALESPSIATSSATLAEAIRLGLADEITSGNLSSGTVIDELDVARKFGASRTPVREALRALAASGLVEIAPRRGARVIAFTAERLGELFELMAETEALCIRLATFRMTSSERIKLQTLHREAGGIVKQGDVGLYDEQNRLFHATIYQASHNAALADHASSLRFRLAPFRRAQFNNAHRLRDSHEEHGAILLQVLQGDGESAARLMRAHMFNASASLAEYLDTLPKLHPSR